MLPNIGGSVCRHDGAVEEFVAVLPGIMPGCAITLNSSCMGEGFIRLARCEYEKPQAMAQPASAMTRWVAGSRNRKPWDTMFFSGAFGVPLSVAEAGPYGDVLESVRLGPSASNKQPWRVVKQTDSNIFHLILERPPGYQRNFDWATNADLQRLDMGIAMCHFELVARERGLEGSWQALQPPALDLPAMTQHIATWVGLL